MNVSPLDEYRKLYSNYFEIANRSEDENLKLGAKLRKNHNTDHNHEKVVKKRSK